MKRVIDILIGVVATLLVTHSSIILNFLKGVDYKAIAVFTVVYFACILFTTTIKFFVVRFKETEEYVIYLLGRVGWSTSVNQNFSLFFKDNMLMQLAFHSNGSRQERVADYLPVKYDLFSRVRFFLFKQPLDFESQNASPCSLRLEKNGLGYALILTKKTTQIKFYQK